MTSSRKFVAFISVLLLATAALAIVTDAETSSADTAGSIGNFKETASFKDGNTGTISIDYSINGSATMTFKALDNGSELASKTIDVDGKGTVELSFKLGEGSHTIMITASGVWAGSGITIPSTDITGSGSTIQVNVPQGFWSNWVPYAVIVIAVIVVIAVVLIYMRYRPKTAPAITFNDLEEGKGATVADTSKKKYDAGRKENPSTERIKYVSERRK